MFGTCKCMTCVLPLFSLSAFYDSAKLGNALRTIENHGTSTDLLSYGIWLKHETCGRIKCYIVY